MIREAYSRKPRMKIHASTLLGVYNADTVRLLREMGVSRIVLSTNLFLDEIDMMIRKVPDMEYEMVADGGICFNDNRICELPHCVTNGVYTVGCRETYYVDGDRSRPASIGSKALRLGDTVRMYMETGICSFKIEGRTVDWRYTAEHARKLSEAVRNAALSENESALHYIRRTSARRQ